MDTDIDFEIYFKQNDFEITILTNELSLLESVLPDLMSSMIQSETDGE